MIVVTHDYWPDADTASGVRGVAKRALLDIVARDVRRLAARTDARHVITSTSVARRLAGRMPGQIATWAEVHTAAVNAADYDVLHEFADTLARIAVEAPPGLGLVHRGVPLCDILEMRWLDPLLNTLLFYAQVLDDRFEAGEDGIALPTGRSMAERLGTEVARQRGARVEVARSYAGSLALTSKAPDPVADFRRMTDRDLAQIAVAPPPTIERSDTDRVVFVGRVDRTLGRLWAALPVLQQQCEPVLLYSWRVKTHSRFQEAGVPTESLYAWMSHADAIDLTARTRRESLAGWEYVSDSAARACDLRYRGVRLWAAAEPMLRAVYLEGAARAALFVELAARALDRLQPRLVVSFEDAEANRAFSRVGERWGVQSLAYYCLSPANYPALVRRSQRWLAASGSALRDNFADGSHRWDRRVRVVGDTLVDTVLSENREAARTRVCARFGLDASRPIVLLISTWIAFPMELSDVRAVFQRTARAVSAISGAQLIVKAHPLQALDQVRAWMAEWGCEGCAVGDADLLEISRAADIVSTPTSSAVWQCMLAGTPVICVQPRPSVERFEPLQYQYLAGRGVRFVEADEDAAATVRELLFDDDARRQQIRRGYEHVEDHVGPLDGHSSERLTDYIAEILATTRQPAC